MRRLPHGYTNRTVGDGTAVVKTYDGPDAEVRRRREHAALTVLRGKLPLPPVLDADDQSVTVGFVHGVHGQDLLSPPFGTAEAGAVLAACGRLLGRIHRLDTGEFRRQAGLDGRDGPDGPDSTGVLVHGDYGPNNLLFDPVPRTEDRAVTAVLDWEFAHVGGPVEDLAWCEWIVRMHHPDRVPLLGAFFEAYDGDVPGWAERKAAMLTRCRDLLDFCRRWEPDGGGVRQWRERIEMTESWSDKGPV